MVVIEKRMHALGEEHSDTLTSMEDLVVTYFHQQQWRKAKALEVVVMEKRMHILGEKHPDTLRSMEALVIIYKWLGQRNEAKALKEKISIY